MQKDESIHVTKNAHATLNTNLRTFSIIWIKTQLAQIDLNLCMAQDIVFW